MRTACVETVCWLASSRVSTDDTLSLIASIPEHRLPRPAVADDVNTASSSSQLRLSRAQQYAIVRSTIARWSSSAPIVRPVSAAADLAGVDGHGDAGDEP